MTLAQQLISLESAGLIRLALSQPEIEYFFRHALIYEAVHGSIVKHDRSQLHGLVGEILERQYPDRLDSRDLAPLLAYHFDQGKDDERALKYYTLAGDAAFASYGNLEAIAHYTRAIELLHDDVTLRDRLLHLYSRRGRAYEISGQYPLARDNYANLLRIAQEHGDRSLELQAMICLATIYVTPSELHDIQRGTKLLNESLDLARTLNDRKAQVKILWNQLLLHRFDDTPQQEVIALGEQALQLAHELNLKEQTAYILNDLNINYFMTGQFEKGTAALQKAQQLWRELNNLAMLADSLSGEVESSVYKGEFDRAMQLYQEARHYSESIGNMWNQSYSRYAIGTVFFERGEISEAITVMQDCIGFAKAAGFIVAQVEVRPHLSMVYAYIGKYQTAFQLIDLAEEIARDSFPAAMIHPTSNRARVHVRVGELDTAAKMLSQLDINSYHGMQYYSIYYWLALSELHVKQSAYAEALQTLDRFENELKSFSVRLMEYEIDYLKGLVFLHLDRLDEAEAALIRAKNLATEIGSRRILWQILIALSEIEVKRGHELAAYKLRQRAKQIVEYIAAHIDELDLRESFMNLPHIHEILNDN